MHILEIDISNTRRLLAFKYELNGRNMEVAGDTGTGKTTAVSALWGILKNKSDSLTHGKKRGHIQITIGDGKKTIVAKRINTKSNSRIELSDADGKHISLKDFKQMVSELSINPHKISQMKPQEQVATLLRAADIGDRDLESIDKDIAHFEEGRLEFHRKAALLTPGEKPKKIDPVSSEEIRAKIKKATEYNKSIKEKEQLLCKLLSDLNHWNEAVSSLEEQLLEAKNKVKEIQARVDKGKKIMENRKEVDMEPLWDSLNKVEEINKQAAEYETWEKRNKEYEENLHAKNIMDLKIKDLREEKKEILDNAKWPLEGLSIEDGEILYNGCSLSNLGESEQMLVCAALAVADIKDHDIKVVRMDGVESMSKDDFKQLQKLFNDRGVQVLSTRVARNDIKDGEIEIVEGRFEDRF